MKKSKLLGIGMNFGFAVLVLLATIGGVSAEERTTGWQCPAGSCDRNTSDPTGNWHGYIGAGPSYGYHIGIDYMYPINHFIYAVANGEIVNYSSSLNGYGNACGDPGGAMLVKHIAKGHDGYSRTFYALYGHMHKTSELNVGDIVEKGEILGNLHYYSGPSPTCNADWTHLHFGIKPDVIDSVKPFRGIADSTSSDNGWVHPMNFLDDNFPADYNVSCSKLEEKYPDVFQQMGIYGCQSAAYVYPNQYVVYNYVYEGAMGYWGLKTVYFEVDSDANVVVLNDDAPEGVGFGGGPGYAVFPDSDPDYGLPDFIMNNLVIKDSSGAERYSFYKTETIQMHSYSKNVGQADWAAFPGESAADDIYVKFYLSNGYKEDSHSDWKCVGTEQIQKGNLDVSVTKHEWTTFNLNTANNGNPLEPGIYNIVACVDRKYDQNNGDGEVPEMHKSNNCNTEAVFKVADFIPGDLNFDRKVDIFDYNILMSNFGQTNCGNVADIDGNCNVNIFDYNILLSHYGESI